MIISEILIVTVSTHNHFSLFFSTHHFFFQPLFSTMKMAMFITTFVAVNVSFSILYIGQTPTTFIDTNFKAINLSYWYNTTLFWYCHCCLSFSAVITAITSSSGWVHGSSFSFISTYDGDASIKWLQWWR